MRSFRRSGTKLTGQSRNNLVFVARFIRGDAEGNRAFPRGRIFGPETLRVSKERNEAARGLWMARTITENLTLGAFANNEKV